MGENPMTVKEMADLSDWLKAKGHTADEILECIAYLAHDPAVYSGKSRGGMKKSGPASTRA